MDQIRLLLEVKFSDNHLCSDGSYLKLGSNLFWLSWLIQITMRVSSLSAFVETSKNLLIDLQKVKRLGFCHREVISLVKSCNILLIILHLRFMLQKKMGKLRKETQNGWRFTIVVIWYKRLFQQFSC